MEEDLVNSPSGSLPLWLIFTMVILILAIVGAFIFLHFQKRKFKKADNELSRIPREWISLMRDKDISGS